MVKQDELTITSVEGNPDWVQYIIEFRSKFYGHFNIQLLSSSFCQDFQFKRWPFEVYDIQPEDKDILESYGAIQGNIKFLPRESAFDVVRFFSDKKATKLQH